MTGDPTPRAATRGVAAALAHRLATDPARPMLTFYDDRTGERTELSATTLDNWVAKTANLLTDSLGVTPGDRVGIDLPAHWQTVAVLLAAWTCGLEVVLPDGSGSTTGSRGPGDLAVAFVAEPDAHAAGPAWVAPDAGDLVVLSLRPFGGTLTTPIPGAVDYAGEVAAHGDRFGAPATTPTQLALLARATGQAADWRLTAGDRLLAVADRADPGGVLSWLLVPLVSGASVVLSRHLDPAALPRRVTSEQVTAVIGADAPPVDGVRTLAGPGPGPGPNPGSGPGGAPL